MRVLAGAVFLAALGASPGPCVTRPVVHPGGDGGAAGDAAAQSDAAHAPPWDAGPLRDAGERPDLGRTFCTAGPQMEINSFMYAFVGWEPTVEARIVPRDGVDSVALIFTPPDGTGNRVVFRWEAARSATGQSTMQVDLANPPTGFSFVAMTGCQEPLETCANPTDSVTAGDGTFLGWLRLSGLGGGPDYTMTLCAMGYSENPFAPNPVIHFLALWSGEITARGP